MTIDHPVLLVGVFSPQMDKGHVKGKHETLHDSHMFFGPTPDDSQPQLLWTENETNSQRLHGVDNYTPYTKDAFHR